MARLPIMSSRGSVPRGLVARALTQLTLDECATAVGAAGLSPGLKRLAVSPFVPLARRLGEEIGAFDAGASVSLEQSARVYDALLLFATLPRADLRVIAADRSFLRSLPSVGRHLVYVPESPPTSLSLGARGRGLRQVVRHLKGGGAVLHFAAGQIEPDPAFSKDDRCLGVWPSGAAALAAACIRLGGRVVLALVSGVHSPRVKQSALIRFAEARGVTTLSALIQIALPRLFTVSPLVRYSAPLPTERGETPTTEHLQHVLRRLWH